MKNKIILGVITGVIITIIASQTLLFANNDKASNLINTVLKDQATIQKTIPINKNLQAYILAAKANGHKAIAFGDTENQYLILGNVLDNKGTNLTQVYTDKYILPEMLKKTFSNLKKTTLFAQGNKSAEHHVVIAVDPNCIYCNLLYKELQPQIEKGNLHVHWLMVGILKQSSIDKAAAILAGKTNAERIANLKKDEENFNNKQEEGGVVALDKNDKNFTSYKKQVEDNTKFLLESGYEGTPVMLYKDKTGNPRAISGYLKGQALNEAIEQMGGH